VPRLNNDNNSKKSDIKQNLVPQGTGMQAQYKEKKLHFYKNFSTYLMT